jgi:hypothetical protein
MENFQGIQCRFRLEGGANPVFALMRLRFRNKILGSPKAMSVSPELAEPGRLNWARFGIEFVSTGS